jgi:3-dehydroquinate dehydratase-1
MICVSLDERYDRMFLRSIKGLEFAEIRMDRMEMALSEVKEIFSQPIRLIATCRPGHLDDLKRKDYLIAAIEAGASYVDIEIESDSRYRRTIRKGPIKVCMVTHIISQSPRDPIS